MANVSKQEVSIKEETVTPAGGASDSEAVREVLSAVSSLHKKDGVVNVTLNKPYTRIALEAAIPTAVFMGGLVGTVAVLTFIDSKFGNGSRVQQLIDKGMFDTVGQGNPEHQLSPAK